MDGILTLPNLNLIDMEYSIKIQTPTEAMVLPPLSEIDKDRLKESLKDCLKTTDHFSVDMNGTFVLVPNQVLRNSTLLIKPMPEKVD